MLNHIPLECLICIDIETVSAYSSFKEVPESFRDMYLAKAERLREEGETDEDCYTNHAAIYAEFGKVVCISVGIFVKGSEGEPHTFRIKSFSGDDEKQLLTEFAQLLNTRYADSNRYQFAGHNIREFDIPYLCRRMLINQIPLANMLDLSGKKPYEVFMVDTMQLWKFGDFKHFTSLNLIALLLGIESPKGDIAGKDVGRVYWQEKNLNRIVEYCQRDVVTVAQLILRFKHLPLLPPADIVMV